MHYGYFGTRLWKRFELKESKLKRRRIEDSGYRRQKSFNMSAMWEQISTCRVTWDFDLPLPKQYVKPLLSQPYFKAIQTSHGEEKP